MKILIYIVTIFHINYKHLWSTLDGASVVLTLRLEETDLKFAYN